MKKQTSCMVIGALPRSLINFRGSLIKAMKAKGIKVHAVANGQDPDTEARLKEWGVTYYPINISRTGINPFSDIQTNF